ncbi:MAG: hypothetical protein D6710_01850 [Nitrospirae bacterium]|nr:MAG: hypothetical protein D6710_01850 [Nitrospirota bacterium]
MSDLFSAIDINPADLNKLREHLEKIREAQANGGDLYAVVGEAAEQFNKFFKLYGLPYFTAHKLYTNDTPSSEVYNENIISLANDLERLYSALTVASESTTTAYNFVSVVTNEVKNSAEIAASKVLDLNILNGFNKGSVIVAGDDFIDSSKIDSSVGVETTQAEILEGGAAIALKRVDSVIISQPETTTITITPLAPTGPAGKVNTDPTPGNVQRIYEGMFYAPLGEMRPEGGTLKLTYIADPSKIPDTAVTTTVNGQVDESQSTEVSAQEAQDQVKGIGFFAIMPATEEEKQAIRKRMLDGNPDTFWEIEFVYDTEPLITAAEVESTEKVISATKAQATSADEAEATNG